MANSEPGEGATVHRLFSAHKVIDLENQLLSMGAPQKTLTH